MVKTPNRVRLGDNKRVFEKIMKGERIVAFVDTETTGLSFDNDRLTQVAGLKFKIKNGALEKLSEFNELIKPSCSISEEAAKKTGITELILENAPTERVIFPVIRDWLSDVDVFVAYNTPFDITFIENMYKRYDCLPPFKMLFDVMVMARDLIPETKVAYPTQGHICSYLKLELQDGHYHDALSDISQTVRVFETLKDSYKKWEPVSEGTIVPVVYRTWLWDNPKNRVMQRRYFQTSFGQIFYNKNDRSFGIGKDFKYDVTDIDWTAFINNVFGFMKVKSLEDLTHLERK